MGTKVWPVALLMLLLLAFIGFWLSLSTGAAKVAKNSHEGLIYDVQMPAGVQGKLSEQQRLLGQTVEMIQKRLNESLGSGKAQVKVVDTSSIQIVLAKGQSWDPVRPVVEASANLQVLWAKNVSTELDPNRQYRIVNNDAGGAPTFVDVKGKDQKPFGTDGPAYLAMLGGWMLVADSDDVDSCSLAQVAGANVPSVTFKEKGSKKLEAWSRKYSNQSEFIAIVLDQKVLSIATIMPGTVLSGRMVINGKFDEAEAARICSQISAGKLPVKIVERKPASEDKSKRPFG